MNPNQWILEVLTLLGQMDHPPRDSGLNGIMTMAMRVDKRRELIASGWAIVRPDSWWKRLLGIIQHWRT